MMALISSFVLSLLVGSWVIARLKRSQYGGETIREDTPAQHRRKAGTPTMGGILILAALLASTLLWANLTNRYIWIAILATSGFGVIGLWDDLRKLRTRRGIPARSKFLAQMVLVLVLLSVLTKAELLLPLIGGLYGVEAVSVIIQVASFKLTGRRVFRMAPLHHHFELEGWAEPKITVRFWIVSFALALLALTTLKLR